MAKKVLTTGVFTFNSVDYVVTALRFNEIYGQVDVTDTGTTGDGKEYLGGRAERSLTIELWNDVASADAPMNTEYAAVINFEGKTYGGSAILLEKATEATIDNGVKTTYTGRFNGTVTVTPET